MTPQEEYARKPHELAEEARLYHASTQIDLTEQDPNQKIQISLRSLLISKGGQLQPNIMTLQQILMNQQS